MSRDRFKARDRITQKMTRNGLVERNETTGIDRRVSKRDAEVDLQGAESRLESYSQVGNRHYVKIKGVKNTRGSIGNHDTYKSLQTFRGMVLLFRYIIDL